MKFRIKDTVSAPAKPQFRIYDWEVRPRTLTGRSE